MWLVRGDPCRPWLTECNECKKPGQPDLVEFGDLDSNEMVSVCRACLKKAEAMMSDGKPCGHGPNECDPRNPECVADIIATQRREIERLKDALARKLADVLREEIFRPCIERAFGTPVVVGRYDMTTPCPHVWANARTGPDGSDEVSCARCGARPAGGAPSH